MLNGSSLLFQSITIVITKIFILKPIKNVYYTVTEYLIGESH